MSAPNPSCWANRKYPPPRLTPDGPTILDNLTLHVQPGEFVALVGASGSGKSTLLRLLLGFETPTSGSIYYDQQDLAGLDPGALRRQIGVVLQNGQLLAGDIYTNIIGSAAKLTLDDAWEAAEQAGIAADIRAMPMGMFTLLNDGGGALSGGQRQRLLIARAIVNRPRIVFFDEATSALDNRTQETVSASLDKLRATRIVIAHRLSTVQNADRICVLEGGKLVQSGTYAELIAQAGLFADLAHRQLV
jgi:ABC-type bacteriocin/lantibiotic exporter with double-glycine peptidase domain